MYTDMEKVKYMQRQYGKALETLQEAVFEKNINPYVKDATIQRFEYTYELAWNLIKAVLKLKGLELRYPRDIFAEAFSSGWINNAETWDDMIEDRNMTAHTYKARNADKVYSSIVSMYYTAFKELEIKIGEVVDNDSRKGS